jgi:ABC-type polysaccharide/polyol phosphate transport system ATPase subunit
VTAPAISLESASKAFRVGRRADEGLLARVVGALSGRGAGRPLDAVRDVTLRVEPGEAVAVIGRNGSGKSTLLRLIAGIHEPDSGTARATGRVLYASGLSHAIKPRLTVRENVQLVGAIMGLGGAAAREEVGPVLAFAGLEDFADAKVCHLSSGMASRLAFALFARGAARLEPDVLLLDEVIGPGGDAAFRRQAAGTLRELLSGGAAALLVSHSLGELEGHCRRAVWLDRGSVRRDGPFAEVAGEYLAAAS